MGPLNYLIVVTYTLMKYYEYDCYEMFNLRLLNLCSSTTLCSRVWNIEQILLDIYDITIKICLQNQCNFLKH